MLTFLAAPALLILTLFCGGIVLVAQLLGIPDGPGTIYEKAPRWWAKGMLFVSGTKVIIHGAEQMHTGEPRIFVSNHVSWYDVLALVAYLPRYSFVAKAEIFRVPLFGGAARAVGTIPIERENRKAAFQSYEEAAARMKGGRNVVVFPEGTRGPEYALRPFKKGPFVLAIAAKAPVVPVLVYGAREVMPKGSFRVRSGTVHIHFLEAVETAGCDYDHRHEVMQAIWDRMADCLRREYGIASKGQAIVDAAVEPTVQPAAEPTVERTA